MLPVVWLDSAIANQVRIFNSLDAAFAACQAVGFRAVTVHQG